MLDGDKCYGENQAGKEDNLTWKVRRFIVNEVVREWVLFKINNASCQNRQSLETH